MPDATAFVNGDVWTMSRSRPRASVVVCEHGRVTAVGGAEVVPAGAQVVDVGGKVVIPGFVDAHCHAEMTSVHLEHAVQCFTPPKRSLAEICQAVAARVAEVNPGEWIVGRGNFAIHRWVEEQRPLVFSDLDAVAPDNPAVVFAGLHSCTLNTRAMEVTGLLTDPPPPGSSFDPLTGRGTEMWDKLPLPAYGIDATKAALARRVPELFVRNGVTSIGEIVFSHDGVRAFQQMKRDGVLPLRVKFWPHVPRIASVADIAASGLESGFGDEWLQLGGIKMFVDGAGFDVWGNAEPACDRQWSQHDLNAAVWDAHRAGLQLLLHVAPTLTGTRMAADALEQAITRLPGLDHRHRIEHLGDMVPDPPMLTRLQQLGVEVLSTPHFLYSSPEDSVCPLRTLQAMGFRVPGNSDVTGTQPEAANPFWGIWCAVARESKDGSLILPDESISVEAAIRMYTADAAYSAHWDDRGVLEPGMLADLVVLAQDPFAAAVSELPDIRVEKTVIGGEIVWDAAEARS